MYDALIKKLYTEYASNGFLSESRVFDTLQKEGASLFDVEYVCDQLLLRGVVIGEPADISRKRKHSSNKSGQQQKERTRNSSGLSKDALKKILEDADLAMPLYVSFEQKTYPNDIIERLEELEEIYKDDPFFDPAYYVYSEYLGIIDDYKRIVQLDKGLYDVVEYMKGIKPTYSKELHDIIPQLKGGSVCAKNRVFDIYMGIAARIALRYVERYRLSISDTIQDAFLGLLDAVDQLENTNIDQYISYFSAVVKNNVQRRIVRNAIINNLTLPVTKRKLLFDYRDFLFWCDTYLRDEYSEHYTCNLIPVISEAFNCDEEDAKHLYVCMHPFLSVEELTENEIEDYPDDRVSDNGSFVDELIERADVDVQKEYIKRSLDSLTEMQQLAIRLRYGLDSGSVMTLEEVANELGVSRERIRQIELKFKEQVAKHLDKRHY